LALLDPIGRLMVTIEPDAARAVADFHTLFNLTALLFLPRLGLLARLLVIAMPARAAVADPSLGEMLRAASDALDRGDRKRLFETEQLDTVLDLLISALKEYLTVLERDTLDTADDRWLLHLPPTLNTSATLSLGV
jgi:phosphate:Na+ symporter